MSATSRAYAIRLARDGETVAVDIRRRGPDQPTRLGLGRPIGEAGKIAALLFPICPIAQAAGALSAAEAASGLDLPPAQASGRRALVLGEAIFGAAWRAALVWAPLLKRQPDAQSVQAARKALSDLQSALYAGEWRRLGGAPLFMDRGAIEDAVHALERVCPVVDALAEAMATLSADQFLGRSPAPLADAVFDPDIRPGLGAVEETHPESVGQTLPNRFRGQALALRRQAADLRKTLDGLGSVDRAQPDEAPAMALEGAGLSVTETARGRLRHFMRVEDGQIVHWQVDAPTDWNFAPDGAFATLASGFDPLGDLVAQGRLLAAALDPCAACHVEEAAYA